MTGSIITVAQQKGGAGKTTLTAHLAVALAGTGSRVALLDIDPQGSLSAWYAQRERSAETRQIASLTHRRVSGWRVENELSRLAAEHDVVLIDSAPHAETEARIAVRAADLVLVPVQPSPLDLWATQPTVDLIGNHDRRGLLVLNRVPPKGRLADKIIEGAQGLGLPVAGTRLGNRVNFAEAMMQGLGITEYERRSPSASEVIALCLDVTQHLARAARDTGTKQVA